MSFRPGYIPLQRDHQFFGRLQIINNSEWSDIGLQHIARAILEHMASATCVADLQRAPDPDRLLYESSYLAEPGMHIQTRIWQSLSGRGRYTQVIRQPIAEPTTNYETIPAC